MTSPSADQILVFAYGSNMLSARIQKRCPSARACGVARLPGYDLAWHKRSEDGSGKCDVVTGAADSAVFGVVYAVARSEKAGLDRAEGLGVGYQERAASVVLGDSATNAVLYVATQTDPKLLPYSWYRDLVVAGAQEHGLPQEYLHRLQAAPAKEDPNRERHARNMALIPRGANP
jgi:cation transport regulator ChaC